MTARFAFFAITLVLLAGVSPSVQAGEITFQPSEVDVGQGSADSAIAGNEWLSYGINMSGSDLNVYTATDPFTPDNVNGVFEGSAGSFEIEFTSPAINLAVSWWSPASSGVTITAFDANGVEIDAQTSSAESDVFNFSGAVQRIVIEAPPFTLCVANLNFGSLSPALAVPTLSHYGLIAMFLALLMLGGLMFRRRGSGI